VINMADKTSFTQDEWKLVSSAPMLAGTGISALDWGVVKFAREFTAMVKVCMEAQETSADSPLLAAVLAEEHEDNKPKEGEKLDVDAILGKLGQAAQLVDAKASTDEALRYKRFLVTVAERTAESAGDGFLGFGGEKTNAAERNYIDKLRGTLGLA
jgi:hypothetical protein